MTRNDIWVLISTGNLLIICGSVRKLKSRNCESYCLAVDNIHERWFMLEGDAQNILILFMHSILTLITLSSKIISMDNDFNEVSVLYAWREGDVCWFYYQWGIPIRYKGYLVRKFFSMTCRARDEGCI